MTEVEGLLFPLCLISLIFACGPPHEFIIDYPPSPPQPTPHGVLTATPEHQTLNAVVGVLSSTTFEYTNVAERGGVEIYDLWFDREVPGLEGLFDQFLLNPDDTAVLSVSWTPMEPVSGRVLLTIYSNAEPEEVTVSLDLAASR